VGIAAFKDVEARVGSSVVLIVVAYDLVRGDQMITHWSSGSGFFVTPDGLIVTNKHVVQPWKFSAEVVAQLDAGFELDPDSLRVGAWQAGANLRGEQGEFDVGSGYFSGDATLSLYRTTVDRLELRPSQLPDGSTYMAMLHAMGPGDLAVLKAEVRAPVRSFPLPPALPGIGKLDPVLVLGFPRGIALLEGQSAELSVALGEVSKIEHSIMITAPVVPGNSGGPAVDRQGRVIGVATLTPGQGLGICLPSSEFLGLLPTAGELLASAGQARGDGRFDEVRAYLELARLRDPSPVELRRIDGMLEQF
jgi:S1-C subfamily serine protease